MEPVNHYGENGRVLKPDNSINHNYPKLYKVNISFNVIILLFFNFSFFLSFLVDGALGLSLEERAKLASEARYALKIYSRERCYLPGRIFARLYDGIRHWQDFGYWSTEGMTWPEVKLKYSREARKVLGENATDDQIIAFVYRRIVDRACSTNGWIDHLADKKMLDVVGANVELILNQKKDKEPIPSLDENEYSFDFYDSTNSESESSLSLEPSLAVVIPIIVIPWIHKHIVNNMLLHKLKHLFSV